MPEVLHLVSSFHQGGSERQALQLAGLLKRSGRYRVRIACLRRQGVLLDEAEALAGDISEYPLTSFFNANAAMQLWNFAERLRRDRIAIVQTHDFYSNVFGMAGGFAARVPARIAARRETAGIRTPAQKIVERYAYRLANAVVVNAEAVGEQLVREGVPPAKITTIYNSLDALRVSRTSDIGRSKLLASLGLPEAQGRLFVTIVANMRYAVKDHPTFLRAARIVASAVPTATFLLAGEGPLLDGMKNLAEELGLGQRAMFLGRCDAVHDLLATSDVCVLSSTAEGFPNAVLEYMAAGCPVVATDVGGIREAILEGQTGHLVPPGAIQQMADRIIQLLNDPATARTMGQRGRQMVAERFSCDAQLVQTEALYGRLLSR